MNLLKYLLIFLFLFAIQFLNSQEKSLDTIYIQSSISPKHTLNKWIEKGFIFASLDSVNSKNLVLNLNSKFDTIVLTTINSNLSKSTYLKSIKDVNKQIQSEFNQLITSGYLRANYKLDTFFIENSTFYVNYTMNSGIKFKLDSLRIIDNEQAFNPRFLKAIFSNSKSPGQSYDYQSIENMVKFSDYMELDRNLDFSLIDSTSILNLYIKERKLNQINATVGILSNAYESNSVKLTGDVNLFLQNIFKHGISLNLNWQKNLTNSQFLFSKFNLPYFLNTQFGFNNQFSIEKFDTQYQRIQNQLSIDYYLSSNQSISAIYKYQSSTIDKININQIKNRILPSYLDYYFQQLGFGYKISKLQKPLFPRKGFKIETNILFGTKNVTKNLNIVNDSDYFHRPLTGIYDSIKLNQTIASFQLQLTHFTKLSKDLVIRSIIDAKGLLASDISLNEMQNIGGIRFPRGYDDNSLISPNYFIFSNDLQYYLSEYFYSNIFADISIMQNSLDYTNFKFPLGLGFGLSFKSSSNIFQLNIGTSIIDNNSFSISNSKVHIQFTNVF